jgi:tetratricopeptide (TPR) repeat protein
VVEGAGLISTDLAESGGLSVVSTPRVLSARREVEGTGAFDMASAEQTARAAGAAVMIVGQIARAGDRFVLTAEWIDVPSGQSIGSHRQDAETMDGFFALADSVADAAREALGVVPVVSGIDLDRALTASADAYKHYVLGDAAEREGADWEKAAREYKRAISVDPTFALAYLRAGIALTWAQRAERAMEIMEDGMPYIDRLPERWQVVYRATMDFGALRTEAAYEALSALVKQQVDVPIAYYLLGEIMTHSDRHEDIREARRHFQRALDLDPNFMVMLLDHLVRGYIAGDDLEDAQRLVARLVEADDTAASHVQNLILWGEGRLEEAIAQGEAILSARGQDGFYVYLLPHLLNAVGDFERAAEIATTPDVPGLADRSLSLGRALIGLGRVDEALGEYSRGAAEQRGTFSRGVAANMEVSRSLLFLFQGEVATAGEAARRALEIEPFFHGARYVLGVVQIRSGDETAARRTLSELREAIGQSVGAGGSFWEHLLATEIAIAEGNLTAARASFERVRGMPPEYRHRREERVVLARLNEAEGDLPAAVDAMRDALDPRHDFWGSWYEFSFLSIIQYELAQLEERAGQSAAAVASYRRFLDRWGKAEDAFPAVAHARERIATLEED